MGRRVAIVSVACALALAIVAPAAEAAPPAPAAVRLIDVKFDKHHGTATIVATVSGPGRLFLSGNKVVPRSVPTSGAGVAKLKVAAKGFALKTLIQEGTVRVGVRVTFLAAEGARATVTRTIGLHRARHPRAAGPRAL
jgi:hypothetical protein